MIGKSQKKINQLIVMIMNWNNMESLDALLNQADQFIEGGKFDEAKILYKKIITLQPEHYFAHFGLATCYEHQSKYIKAMEYLEKIIEFEDIDKTQWNEVNEALRLVQHLRIIEKADFIKKKNDIENAIVLYQQALNLVPDNAYLHLELCECFLLLEQNDKSIDHYEQLIELVDNAKDQCDIYGILSHLYKEVNDVEKLRKALEFRLYHENDDEFSSIKYDLAELTFKEKNYIKSRRLIDEFSEQVRKTDMDDNDRTMYENSIINARLGIYITLKEYTKAHQLARSYLSKVINGEIDFSYITGIRAVGILEDLKDFEFLQVVIDCKLLESNEDMQDLPLNDYYSAIITKHKGEYKAALKHFISFKKRIKELLENNEKFYNEIWIGISEKESDDGWDFSIADSDPSMGIYIDNSIEELKHSIAN